MQWLADFGPRFPREAVRCLELFAEGCDWDFHMSLWNAQANAVLGAALADPQPEIRNAAAELINRLGSARSSAVPKHGPKRWELIIVPKIRVRSGKAGQVRFRQMELSY